MERHRGRHVNYGKYSMHLLPASTLTSTAADDDKEQLLLCFNRQKIGKVVLWVTKHTISNVNRIVIKT